MHLPPSSPYFDDNSYSSADDSKDFTSMFEQSFQSSDFEGKVISFI